MERGPFVRIAELIAARAIGARVVYTHHLPSLGYLCRAGWLMERGTTPCDGVADTNVVPRGNGSVTVTPVAWSGPVLVTTIV